MSLKTLGLRDLIILFALILSTFFLNGCSGCTYFFLKIESLDKSNQDLGSTQGGQNPGSSDVNSPTSFQIIITNGTVLRGANDTTYTDFITLKFDTTITEELSIQLDSSLSEATVSDFELPITTISFAKGEQE